MPRSGKTKTKKSINKRIKHSKAKAGLIMRTRVRHQHLRSRKSTRQKRAAKKSSKNISPSDLKNLALK